MVWVAMKNGSGQVVKGVRVREVSNSPEYLVVSSQRLGINRYKITLQAPDGIQKEFMNHEIRKWEVVGNFLSPEDISLIYNKKVDPDANLPRPMRESFWKMKSKPGTHNYRQKKRLMVDPFYIENFGHLFKDTVIENV
jgi:hypothetical protein